jgi:hypothetical protein
MDPKEVIEELATNMMNTQQLGSSRTVCNPLAGCPPHAD